MKFSVQKIYNKGSRKINEDELLIKDNLFAVFDGATSLVTYTNSKGETGAKIAAKIAKKVFSKNNKTLKELAIEANNSLLEEMKKENIDTNKKESLWSTTCAAIRICEKDVEFFKISDSIILVIFKNGSHKLLTPLYDQDIETLVLWKRLAEKKVENIFDVLRPKEIELRKQANIKFGALNGEKEAEKFFNYGKINLENVKSLIIFTDGLMLPKEDPRSPENWDLFVKMYKKSGLKELLKYVRDLEKSDPNCWKYIRYKKHDDVAAIGIDFK